MSHQTWRRVTVLGARWTVIGLCCWVAWMLMLLVSFVYVARQAFHS